MDNASPSSIIRLSALSAIGTHALLMGGACVPLNMDNNKKILYIHTSVNGHYPQLSTTTLSPRVLLDRGTRP